MKIARAITDDGPKTVILYDSRYYDLSEITGVDMENTGPSFFYIIQKNMEKIRDFLSQGKHASLQDIVPKSYLLPIPHVNQIRDFYAFADHVKNARARRGLEVPVEWYEFPAYYYSGNSSLYPSDCSIVRPSFTKELDFEIEIAAVIGKEGRNITKGDAWEHIFGFVLMNDWSARDQQRKEMAIGLGPSKSKDFATSFGRYLVTAEEAASMVDNNGKLNSEVWVNLNGKEFMRNNLSTMHWTFSDLISWASTDVTLRPGDIIMSGTVGNGCILEQGPEKTGWLKPGDVVKFGSDFFGELASNIV